MLQISMISLSEYISLYVGSNACTDERKVELLLIITRTNGFFSVDVSLWMWPQCCQWRTHLAGSFSSLGFLFEPHCNGTELEAGMLILTLKAVLGSIWELHLWCVKTLSPRKSNGFCFLWIQCTDWNEVHLTVSVVLLVLSCTWWGHLTEYTCIWDTGVVGLTHALSGLFSVQAEIKRTQKQTLNLSGFLGNIYASLWL